MSTRKSQPLKCRSWVPDGKGGYVNYDELSEAEKAAFGRRITQRMGAALNHYFNVHPEEWDRI